jgi:hypothetical protein
MGQYRDKNGTAKGQKWDSIETKMGQQRDKNGTVSRQKNIFVSILKIFRFFAFAYPRIYTDLYGFSIQFLNP